MYFINKLITSETVDYAAEELKKYLRMMMPEGGDVKIVYSPGATEGFRLGIMSELGLDTSDVRDPMLDDVVYIDCDTRGGVIAGSNQRSVLLAVYEYLRKLGCRWLFPGVDGEYIPMKNIEPVKYRHKPSCRYRGWCNEGGQSQSSIIDAVEFAPKVGLNAISLEFRIPVSYYRRYYMHNNNEMNRPPEHITNEQILQWKRASECAIAKRSLLFFDVGHGWTADAFGIDSTLRPWDGDNDKKVPENMRQYLPLINGRRGIVSNAPIHTNFCMSNAEARRFVAKYVADYAENHENVTYLVIGLADGTDNQCECEACREKTPSDFYVMLLNEIDSELTSRGLDTLLAFTSYSTTIWPPILEKLENPNRFMMQICPISRSYCETLPKTPKKIEIKPYKVNDNILPSTLDESFAYLREWKAAFDGPMAGYEYHFWYHQYFDPAGIELAKRVYEDVKAYKANHVDGMIEDGSQRSFFPSGFAFYTYARTLWDIDLDFNENVNDYFQNAYGNGWKRFYDLLERIGKILDQRYFERELSADESVSLFYNPEFAKRLDDLDSLLCEGESLIKENYNSCYRVQTVSVRLLEYLLIYLRLLQKPLTLKALARDEEALALFEEFCAEFGKYEIEIEPYYDHGTAMMAMRSIFLHKRSKASLMVNEGDVDNG